MEGTWLQMKLNWASMMKHVFRLVTMMTVIAAVTFSIESGAQALDDPSARDLQRIVTWFEGDFDNEEQVWFENDPRSNVPFAERHEPLHVTRWRVHLPAFGEYVFYVEEYTDDNPAKLSSRYLVAFESAREAGIRMRAWFLTNSTGSPSGLQDLSAIEQVTRKDVVSLGPGCDVLWVSQGDQYLGNVQPRACVFGKEPELRYAQLELGLSASKFWRVDRTFLLKSNLLQKGHITDVPYKLTRAKKFNCDIRIDEQSFNDREMLSQGGTIIVTRKTDGKDYVFRIREKEHPYQKENSDFILLSVNRPNERYLAFSVHDRDSRLIGFHTSWATITCNRNY